MGSRTHTTRPALYASTYTHPLNTLYIHLHTHTQLTRIEIKLRDKYVLGSHTRTTCATWNTSSYTPTLYASAYLHTTYTYTQLMCTEIKLWDQNVVGSHTRTTQPALYASTYAHTVYTSTHTHTTYMHRDQTPRQTFIGVVHPHHTTHILYIYIHTHFIYIYMHIHNLHVQRSNSEIDMWCRKWGRTPAPHERHFLSWVPLDRCARSSRLAPVLQQCVAAVCCSSVLQQCVAAVCCSSALRQCVAAACCSSVW